MIDIKTYGLIRRMALDGKTIRSIARELDIARSTVAKYYDGSCIPTAEHRKERTRKRQVVTEDVDSFILECLEEDEREGERKQRHTAHRIFKRLRDEKGFQGAESTIRARCRKLKDARRTPKADIPLLYDPGEAVQVDFGQAKAYVNGEKIKIHYFCARLCYSCAIYVYCGLSENTETFLEGLRNSFEFFHGVPRRVIFDNGGVAVSEGSGKKAVATEKYEAMSAHYGFETVFCNRAAGNEKGLVENLVGLARNEFLTPLPKVESVGELNEAIRKECVKYIEEHHVQGRTQTVADQFETELKHLRKLPLLGFETARVFPQAKVSDDALVCCDANKYSVPVKYVGRTVTVKAYALKVVIVVDSETRIVHDRPQTKNNTVYKLDHYISEIERKPRAAFQAEPVRKTLPDDVFQLCRKLPGADKDMVKVLRLFVEHGVEKTSEAIRRAAEADAVTVDAIRSFIGIAAEKEQAETPGRHDNSIYEPDNSRYDRLLGGGKNGKGN